MPVWTGAEHERKRVRVGEEEEEEEEDGRLEVRRGGAKAPAARGSSAE